MRHGAVDYEPPWLARVTQLHSNAAANVDAERKVAKLNEDMRELAREMRVKVCIWVLKG
jgi:dynactin 1